MARITFDRLVALYRSTAFQDDGDKITVSTQDVLNDLRLIDHDPEAAWLSQITPIDDIAGACVGDIVRVTVGAPSLQLGILAATFDALLLSPRAYVEEPACFYVVDGALTADMPEPPEVLKAYRSVVALVSLLGQAAAYLDPVRQEFVLTGRTRIRVPVAFGIEDLRGMSSEAASSLLGLFTDDVQKDQKLSILARAAADMCAAQPEEERFATLLRGIEALSREVKAGYQLFVSEFSYAKVRRDVETAQFEYLGKIHKTFTDIQGQLLGIPVATFLVVSQMKPASACGTDLSTDVAVVVGSWIYATLIAAAIANQWFTLSAIGNEVGHQRAKVAGDYPGAAGQFAPVFETLLWRIFAHRTGLILVGFLAIAGASAATFAESRIVTIDAASCLAATASTPTPSATSTLQRSTP